MISFDVARVVLSGSFRKDVVGIRRAYEELITNNCQVLSPHRLEFDNAEFVRDTAEVSLSVKSIQDHHLLALKQADFLWLYAPEGYVGTSAAFEVGFASAIGLPIFSSQKIADAMLREYVHCVPSVFAAKTMMASYRG